MSRDDLPEGADREVGPGGVEGEVWDALARWRASG